MGYNSVADIIDLSLFV